MKKRVLLLLPLFLGACSDSGESPVIKIEKLYAKIESDGENTSSDEKDYANQRDELPALKVGDEVKAAQFENLGELVKNTIFVA